MRKRTPKRSARPWGSHRSSSLAIHGRGDRDCRSHRRRAHRRDGPGGPRPRGGRWKSGDRSAVWFAVFAGLYGLRLAGQSQLFQLALPEIVWRYLGAFVTYIIVAPLALFLESLFGPGWRSSVRRIWQAIVVYAPLALILDLVRGRPGETAHWLNGPVVLVAGVAVVGHVLAFWRRESWSAEFRLAAAGGLIFMGVAAYQTFGGALPLEPYAMLLFMTSVGYLVARRMLFSERKLLGPASPPPGAPQTPAHGP